MHDRLSSGPYVNMFDKMSESLEPTVIITAAGNSTRWNNHLNTVKHLAPLGPSGQTVIGRTIKMLKQFGIRNIYVVTKNNNIINSIPQDVMTISPSNSDSLADSILSSRQKWTDRTIVLLGDVFFSHDCLKSILACKSSVKFFGTDRHGSPEFCKEKRCELYAFSFDSSMQDLIKRCLTINSALAHFRDNSSLRFSYLKIPMLKISGCCKFLCHCSYPPKPPGFLIKVGLKRSIFWQVARFLISKPRRTKVYGKLWGLYFSVADIGQFDSEDYQRLPNDNDNKFFHEINDITQDLDTKEDYCLLMEKLLKANSA